MEVYCKASRLHGDLVQLTYSGVADVQLGPSKHQQCEKRIGEG